MPIKISQLPAATALTGAELIPAVQSSATVQTTVGAFKTYLFNNPVVLASTLEVTGATTLDSTLAVTGATTLSSTLAVTGATTLSSTLAVNGASLTSTQTTFNLLNATVTTLNIGGAATTVSIGAATGTTTVVNALAGTIATDSTSTITGAWKTAGGLGVAKALWVGGLTNIAGATTLQGTLTGSDATDATNSTSGAFKTAGGMGIAKALFVGTTLGVAGTATLSVVQTQIATGTAPDATPINIFSTLAAGGLYLVMIGSGDNTVRCTYLIYYNGGSPGSVALDTSNFTISFSGAQTRIVNGSGSSQSYKAVLLRLG